MATWSSPARRAATAAQNPAKPPPTITIESVIVSSFGVQRGRVLGQTSS
jgi:hypothetical protein